VVAPVLYKPLAIVSFVLFVLLYLVKKASTKAESPAPAGVYLLANDNVLCA
jgi:hypothetical protein